MSSDNIIDFNDIIKTIYLILKNDISDDDATKFTLKELCNNRVTQGFNIFKDRLDFPKITLYLDEEEYDGYGISKSYRLFLRGWARLEPRMYKVRGENYAPKTIAGMIDTRIRQLLDRRYNIVGEKISILKIESLSGAVEEEVEKLVAYAKLTIYKMIVKKKS